MDRKLRNRWHYTAQRYANGQLQHDIGDITRRWFNHLKTLFRDHTGNSKRRDHWDYIKPMPQQPMLFDLNAHIKRDEVWKAPEGASRYKGPGIDGIFQWTSSKGRNQGNVCS